jgi:uncharacterized protein with PIN domain
MAILDLGKMTFFKTVLGIVCAKCGGNLKQTGAVKLTDKIVSAATFGKTKCRHYECENCGGKYTIL